MTREDIIRMAREARLFDDDQEPLPEFLERFATLVAEHEREACAKVCTDVALLPDAGPSYCAAAIRARSEKTRLFRVDEQNGPLIKRSA